MTAHQNLTSSHESVNSAIADKNENHSSVRTGPTRVQVVGGRFSPISRIRRFKLGGFRSKAPQQVSTPDLFMFRDYTLSFPPVLVNVLSIVSFVLFPIHVCKCISILLSFPACLCVGM